jgi:hypothetical protein
MVSRFVVLFGFLVVWFLGFSVSWFLSFFVFLVSCSYVTCVFGPPSNRSPEPPSPRYQPKVSSPRFKPKVQSLRSQSN